MDRLDTAKSLTRDFANNIQKQTFLKAEAQHWFCSGYWDLLGIEYLENQIKSIKYPSNLKLIIDGAQLIKLDSAGACLLEQIIFDLKQAGNQITLVNFNEKQSQLLHLVESNAKTLRQKIGKIKPYATLYLIGQSAVQIFLDACGFLAFAGELIFTLLRVLKQPKRIQWRSICSNIEDIGHRGLPIVSLLSFLIGLVLAYQMGLELKIYGANIYIVDISGMAILREFAPLITAILVAGRSGSAFTAQIATMKVNEEIDALKAMGLSPINRLVLPKMFAAIISVPLLVVWSDIFGVFGAMVMAKGMLGVGFYDFLQRFSHHVAMDNYTIGLIKAPVFAMIVASVGCFQGFQTAPNAESIGRQTTKSVVQSIFLIICADAIFSIIFSWQGI